MIDPVTLTLVTNSFVNICREMGITMMRTAFSPIFNEGLDFSCVMFDRDAQVIGQGEFFPAQIAAAIFAGRWTVEELGADAFEPGDVSSTTIRIGAAPTCPSIFCSARLPRG